MSPHEVTLYQCLIDSPHQTVADLSRHCPTLGRQALVAALHRLESRHLVTQSQTRPARYLAADPEVALNLLVLQREESLRHVRAQAGDLARRWRLALRSGDPHELVEIVTGQDATLQRVERLQWGARREVLIFDRLPYVSLANPLEGNILGRGEVTYRCVYDRPSLRHPGVWERVGVMVGAGEQARVLPSVPMKMFMADQEIAIIPLQRDPEEIDSAVLVHPSTLLDALHALFEALWARAVPLLVTSPPTEHGDPLDERDDPLDESDRQLLRLLATGLTDEAVARRLGIGRRTVQRHVARLMALLGADNRFQLGIQLMRQGWL